MLEATTYTQITEKVRISVRPAALEKESDPLDDVYMFSYNITIENLGDEVVQLLERHWIVMSSDVQIAEVVGPGVVGEQPTLEPGQTFDYTSGTVINDPIGSMYGSYTFRAKSGRFFKVEIPKFELLYPIMMH